MFLYCNKFSSLFVRKTCNITRYFIIDSFRKRRRREKECTRRSAILRISNRYVPHMWIQKFTSRCLHLSSPSNVRLSSETVVRWVSDRPYSTRICGPARTWTPVRERGWRRSCGTTGASYLFTLWTCERVILVRMKNELATRGRKLVGVVSLSALVKTAGKAEKKLRAALNSYSKGAASHGNSSCGATSGVMRPGKRDRIKRNPSVRERVMQLLVQFNFLRPRSGLVYLERF